MPRYASYRYTLPYSSTDNYLSPIPVSEWLIFCCGNLTLTKKEMKMRKTQFSLIEKQQKKCKKKYMLAGSCIAHSELSPNDP